MMALAQSDDRLEIGRLSLEYSVSADRQTAQSARQRLDRLLENTLRQKLHGLYDPLRPAGDGLWFIRRLELDADIDLELSDQQIMRNWSKCFARALQSCLLDSSTEQRVYFPDYPDYLGQFVLALARGMAWKAWYFETFSGLRSLPAPMAIVTALLQDPSMGLQSLIRLQRHDIARVLNALSGQGARRLLYGFAACESASQPSAGELSQAVAAQIGGQQNVPLLVTDHPWLQALVVYLGVAANSPQLAGKALAELTLAAVTLGDQVQVLSRQCLDELRSAVLAGRQSELFRLLPLAQAQRLMPLIDLQAHDRQRLLQITQPIDKAQNPAVASNEPRYTAFGGVFLLLPLIRKLPLDEILVSWPEPPAGDKQSVIRLLLLAESLGTGVAGRVFTDPLLRDVLKVPPGLTIRELQDWLNSITARRINMAQQCYASWRWNQSGNDALSLAACGFANRRLAVVTQRQHPYWLLLCGYQPARPNRLLHTIKALLPGEAGSERALLKSAGWALENEAAVQLRNDLEYLALPQRLQPDNHARWLLMTMAQGILCDFARRVPGFSNSSLPHLFDNFLNMRARLEAEPQRWLVRLGRPPLNVVLAMTGMARNQYRLDWRDNQLVELYQGD